MAEAFLKNSSLYLFYGKNIQHELFNTTLTEERGTHNHDLSIDKISSLVPLSD